MIYKVTPKTEPVNDWGDTYATMQGIIIRAKSKDDLWDMLWNAPKYGGSVTLGWDQFNTVVEEINPEGDNGIILEDYLNG